MPPFLFRLLRVPAIRASSIRAIAGLRTRPGTLECRKRLDYVPLPPRLRWFRVVRWFHSAVIRSTDQFLRGGAGPRDVAARLCLNSGRTGYKESRCVRPSFQDGMAEFLRRYRRNHIQMFQGETVALPSLLFGTHGDQRETTNRGSYARVGHSGSLGGVRRRCSASGAVARKNEGSLYGQGQAVSLARHGKSGRSFRHYLRDDGRNLRWARGGRLRGADTTGRSSCAAFRDGATAFSRGAIVDCPGVLSRAALISGVTSTSLPIGRRHALSQIPGEIVSSWEAQLGPERI